MNNAINQNELTKFDIFCDNCNTCNGNDKIITVHVYKLHPDAILPKKQTKGSVGFDLYSIEDVCLVPNEIRVVGTGIAIQLPENFEAQIRSRSGLAANLGIWVLNSPGTIDSDYDGEIKVILANMSDRVVKLDKGSRIAQMVITKVPKIELKWTNHERRTERNVNGFGSTGIA